MLPTKRLHEVGVGLLGISIAIALGCTSIDNATSVHGSAAGFGDGKANNVSVSPPSASVMRGSVTPLKCQALDSRGVVVSSAPSWTIADPGVATITRLSPRPAVFDRRTASTRSRSCAIGRRIGRLPIRTSQVPLAFELFERDGVQVERLVERGPNDVCVSMGLQVLSQCGLDNPVRRCVGNERIGTQRLGQLFRQPDSQRILRHDTTMSR